MNYRHDILRAQRRDTGESYELIASKARISVNATWEAINGKTDPRASTIKKLFRVMGLDPRVAFDFDLKVTDFRRAVNQSAR